MASPSQFREHRWSRSWFRSIMRNVGIAAVLAAAAAPSRGLADEAGPPMTTRRFVLKNVDVKAAAAMLRGVMELRHTAVDEPGQAIIVSDAPGVLDGVQDLIVRFDVPPPRWVARLVIPAESGDEIVREIPLDDKATLVYGEKPASLAQFQIAAAWVGESSLRVLYQFEVRLVARKDLEPFVAAADGAVTATDGTRLDVVTPSRAADRAALGKVLGLEGSAAGLVLQFHRVQ